MVVDRRTGPATEFFTYLVPEELEGLVEEGRRVAVPFGKRIVTGVIVHLGPVSHHPSPKPLAGLAEEPSSLLSEQIQLARWIAHHYAAPMADVTRAMVPPGVRSLGLKARKGRGPKVTSRDRALAADAGRARPGAELTTEQAAAVASIGESLAARRGRLLLHGVTGSGKTEVYLEALARCLALNRGAIVLIPEVSLTPQLTARFAERFAGRLAVFHSRLTASERALEWRRLRDGEAQIAIGPRAAVFAPVPDLGLVIIDEEHSSTYKQNNVPRYRAVDVAYQLADLTGAVVLAGSATPSVTSYYNHGRATSGFEGARILELPERYGGDPLPQMEIADMRSDQGWSLARPLGERLLQLMADELDAGGQVILYLNRRGLAWFARCRRCGNSIGCPNCSVSLVYHGATRTLACHYCGHSESLPTICPFCRRRTLETVGFGTERIEQEVRRIFPGRRVIRLDRDTAKTRDSYYNMWERFAGGEADVMVGTALVAKGWDLPRVGLAGVVDADQALQYPDYRAAEETFSTLVQVGGRVRRAGGRVLVQTLNPNHYALRLGVEHDYHGFVAEELAVREALDFPPFNTLVQVTASASDDAKAKQMASAYGEALRAGLQRLSGSQTTVLGPAEAFVHRLRGEYRWVLTIKTKNLEEVLPLLPDGRGYAVDVEPF